MDDKYNVSKPKKPETRTEMLEQQIRELVAQRDSTSDLAEKQKLNVQITKLFAQYERSKI